MEKLVGYEGGQPVYIDDLLFLQQNAINAVKGVVSALDLQADGVIVLSGCKTVKNERSIDWEEGYIAISGEVYKVNSGSYEFSPEDDDYYWMVKRRQDEFRDFENGGRHPVYEKSEVVIGGLSSEGERVAVVGEQINLREFLDTRLRSFEVSERKAYIGNLNYAYEAKVQIIRTVNLEVWKIFVSGAVGLQPQGLLFRYEYPSSEQNLILTTTVWANNKMCILRLQAGNAYLTNLDGVGEETLNGPIQANIIR